MNNAAENIELKFFYIMDPMCSWCYGFSGELEQIIPQLPDGAKFYTVMGGLAPDSDEPMAPEMVTYLKSAWAAVAERTGAEFNFDFFTACAPQRSTYPACRAVIAAGMQGANHVPEMIAAIQRAYYQQARNPSDEATLVELAGEIGLDAARFAGDLHSPQVEQLLNADFNFRNRLGVQGFPALVLQKDQEFYGLSIGYATAEAVLARLAWALAQ